VFVQGEPAVLWGSNERGWREAVRAAGISGLKTVALEFVVSAWRRFGNTFDLDNLVDPVLDVVGARGELESVWATVAVGATPGVRITEAAPPQPPADAVTFVIARPPRKSVRALTALPELTEAIVLGTDGPLGCHLALGPAAGPLLFGFEGPIKPTIDALWPVLGGVSTRPADHRIRDLRVRLDPSCVGAVVSIWLLT
jgi:hypothetical protein